MEFLLPNFLTPPDMNTNSIRQLIRKSLLVIIIILFLSGLTTIPVESEFSVLLRIFSVHGQLVNWLEKVLSAHKQVNNGIPLLFYGYHWLAFDLFILAILFIAPYRDPVKNIRVIEFGLIACVLILPLAFAAGNLRGIPAGWQFIDCSFGVVGFILLSVCYRKANYFLF